MTKLRKIMSIILAISMAFSLCAGLEISVSAADVQVEIVSFLRGEQTDLKSSELLEARVTGYDGNVRNLTYEWTNGIETYLYVYNNHNMYGINGTEGEIEIYNEHVESSANMSGRSYEDTFSGKGFAWAAIYGANIDNSDLLGTITVNVYDENGNLLATDSHTGTRKSSGGMGGWWPGSNRYTYSGFVVDDLQGDLTATNFGIFEGDSKFIKELFSESSIVHITCVESTIDGANIVSGEDYISLVNNNDGSYTVTALEPGKAELNMIVKKGNCKFHQYTEGETDVTVYVYKRPEPTATTTTITLTNLDDNCTYYIDGVEGRNQGDGTVIFENLTPNTTYVIEAKGQAEGTEAVYAYTTCTTLPVYNATVYVFLNGGYDVQTETGYGTPVDISEVRDTDNALYIKEVDGTEFIQLAPVDTGVYKAAVSNGIYLIYRDPEDYSNPNEQQLIIENGDKDRYLFYYSVEYDAAGGIGAPDMAYYYSAAKVDVTDVIPTREGYRFVAWQDEEGNYYNPSQVLTEKIGKGYTLTAVWEEAADVYVNITLKHTAKDGSGVNGEESRHAVTFTVDSREENTAGNFVEIIEKSLEWDGVGTVEGYDVTEQDNMTVYTATAPVLVDAPVNMEYTFTSDKSYYEIESIEIVEDADGNKVINAVMVYSPTSVDFTFNVTLDDEAKALAEELKPVAANVKVTYYDEGEWKPLVEHENTYIKVALDENGEGSASHSVWGVNADNEPYFYRIEVVSFTLPDGSVMGAENIGGENEEYRTADERYTAVVNALGGQAPAGSSLDGASFTGDGWSGEITAVISIEVFDVTFDPNGGQFDDGETGSKTVYSQIAIPAFAPYAPVREGGYIFDGWYYEGTEEKAVEGTVLFDDAVLVAKWKAPVTIEGTITVAGAYSLASDHVIHDADRVKTVTVLLRHISDNGYEETTKNVVVDITYTDNIGTGTYKFVVPDDGREHHIYAANINHTTVYQNELSESQVVTDYWAYTLTHGEAEFNGDDVAVVNAYLEFDPAVFELGYAVDATAIGEGFRPENVETFILYDDGLKGRDPQGWTVISQMVTGDGFEGQMTELFGGEGENSYPVWQSHAEGNLYDYAIRVDKVDGRIFDAQSAPYMIYYNGAARFSAVNGQTQLLTATIVPKMYTVTFDVNAGEDEVTGMDSYYNNALDTFQDTHYWSFEKEITAKPVRANHVFLGWFDKDGNKVEKIDAAVHENIVLTAQWKALPSYVNDYAYIFGYNDTIMGAEGPLLRCELSAMVHRLVKQNGQLGGFVYDASNPSFNDIAGMWFQSGIEFVNYVGAIQATEGEASQPYVAVTRGEAFRYICLGLGFVTDTELSNQEYADFLFNAGYIQGDGSGDLKVADLITRAEFCTMYNRIIGRADALLIDTDGNEVTAETYGFTDMTDKEVWYYDNMVRATSAYEGEYVSISKRGIRNVLDDYAG
ncbi:MAG: InlB B-repeat-containing protein [Clostridia bacterium]|nr:InlB B-repeat-containing protein [Clostridia bacterium]